MRVDQQSQIYHFSLLFQSVKMKVKFPCKLSLQHMGNVMTNQVSAKEQNKFFINEEVLIKDQSDKKFVEIVVNLITQKGSKYIAGIIKLFHNELLRSEGQRIVVALGKCLDAEAFCEVKVEKVVTQKVAKRNVVFGGSRVAREEQSFSPAQNQVNFKSATILGTGMGTRSQAQFNINPVKNIIPKQWQQKKETCAITYYQKPRPSPPRTRRKLGDTSNIKLPLHMKTHQEQQNTNRQKLIQAEVYKQNYIKLKQKYRKQSENYKLQLNKRIALENNENNYKLEIVRLRLKCQQLEKTYNEKNLRSKQLQGELAILQQRDADIGYYKEEAASLRNNIAMLEDSIITLNRENQKLKQLTKERQHEYETKINALQGQYQKVKHLYQAKQSEYQRDMRVLKQQLIQLQYELNSKTQSLQKQKNYIYQFEKTSQAKLFEFDTLLQNERNHSRVKYDELKARLDKMDLDNKQLIQDKKQLQAEKQSHRSYVMKTEYEYKMHLQELNAVKNELQQMHSLKEKYQKLILQHKALKQQKQFSTLKFDKLIKNKDLSFEEIVQQNKKQIEFIKKINSDLSDKNKTLVQKNIEYQGLAETLKNTIEKNRRALQMVTKDFTQLKEKEKTLKKAITDKDETIDELKDKIEKANAKHSSLIDAKRIQTDKMSQIISKLKLDLQSESSKTAKLTQTNSQLNHEISRLKMVLQFSEQKMQKNTSSAQEKYKSYEAIIQQHQGVISMLQDSINQIKVKQNQLFGKYSQLQNQYAFLKEQHDKLSKEHKILTQKFLSLQSLNKQKSSELASLLSKYQQSQKRNQSLQNQVHQTKTQLSLTRGQKQKTLKLLQIANSQNEKCRQSIIKFSGQLLDKQSKIDSKNKQLAKIQDQLQKANYKAESLSKEYSKFREAFGEMMGASLRQLDNLKHETMALVTNMGSEGTRGGYRSGDKEYRSGDNEWQGSRFPPQSYGGLNTSNQTERKRKFSNQLNPKSFLDITTFTSQIMNTFSSYSKQNQSTITRLIERNKLLNRQLESARNDLSQQVAQNQQVQYEAQRQKQQIQEQLRAITHQKGSESVKLNTLLQQVRQQLYQKQQLLEQAHSQIDELQFTLSSNKMDYDASINELDKKNYHLKHFLQQLQEKNQFQHHLITSLQQKCYQLDKQLIDLNNCIMAEKEISYNRQQQILLSLQEIKQLEELVETEKLNQNKLLQTVSSLQVELATQKQTKLKLQKTLTQEQDKKRQLKAFSANIIKQKETIIKQQLEHHQKLSQLQNKLFQNQHHKQLLLQQIEILKTELSTQKLQIRKVSDLLKDTQNHLSTEKAKLLQTQKLLKQKQKAIIQLQYAIKQINKKHESTVNECKKSILQLNEQISFMANHKQKLTQDMNQKLLQAQKQLKSYQSIINDQKSQLQQLQQHLYAYKQKSRVLQQTLMTRQYQTNQLRYKTQHLEALKADFQQDSKDKQQNMYQLSATIYDLQSRISTLIREKELQVQEVNNQWNLKYEDLYQELEQRFQLLDKEKVYLKEQLLEKDTELDKKSEEKKLLQAQYTASKKLFQDKIKKLQQQRLLLLTTKNNQLHKQSQQLKQLFQTQKKKQAEQRKTSHELQIARNQILKLDARIIELDNKIKSMNKLYNQELEEIKKKELTYKGFKEQVINQQWNTQRELRKTLQAFTKSFLTFTDEARDKTELIQLIKNLQTGIISAIKTFDEKA